MSAIRLYDSNTGNVTCVSNLFIDHLMPEANGEFVKVYLYLLRCLSGHAQDCSVSAIADKLEHTEKDITRALNYWERMKLLKLERDGSGALCGIQFLDPQSALSPDPIPGQQPPEVRTQTLPGNPVNAEDKANESGDIRSPLLPDSRKETAAEGNTKGQTPAADRKTYTPDEIKQFQKDETVEELFFIIETYLKRPLTATDTNTVLYWYDGLHFPADLIIYLVEYCISKGHSSMRYMDKVALGWKDAGIQTIAQAKENAAIHSQAYYSVMKAFGISGRNLVDSETCLIRKWTKEYGFDISVILEACKRTMTATHQPSFEYADSILTSWHNSNVHTMEDIHALDKTYNRSKRSQPPAAARETVKRNKFNNFNQRDYDYEKLEKILLTTKV